MSCGLLGAAKPNGGKRRPEGGRAPPPRKRAKARRAALGTTMRSKPAEFTADELGQLIELLAWCVWRRRHSGEQPPPRRQSSPVVAKWTSAMQSGWGVHEAVCCRGWRCLRRSAAAPRARNHRDDAGCAAAGVAHRRTRDGIGRHHVVQADPNGWHTRVEAGAHRSGAIQASVCAGGCAIWPPRGRWTGPRPPRRSR